MTSHIVFLIDEDPLCSSRNIISKIHLACLRILSYYASHTTKKSIFWGYKFYNSYKSYSNEYKQRRFMEYALEKFNIFEQKLYKKVHNTSCIPNVKPGILLRVALSEILTEFQWDQPELLSPCKLFSNSSNKPNNMVFLITKYPFNNYFNEEVLDKKSFLNALLPPMLFEKFVQQSKIKLYWIYSDTPDEKSCCCVDFVDRGIKMAKGSLISLHAITMLHNDQKCIDIISRDSILQALLNPTKSRHQTQKQQYICKILLSAESEKESFVTLCDVTKRFREHVCFFHNMYVDKLVSKSKVSLKMLQDAYMYCCRPNQAISDRLEEALHSKEVLVIIFKKTDNDRTENRAIMIPYTICTGAIVLLKEKNIQEEEKEEDDFLNNTKNNNAEGYDKRKLSPVDTAYLKELSPVPPHLINTSVVNCVDTWFLSNPFLGLPSKKVLLLKNLDSERVKREENSRMLVTSLKSKLYKTSQPNKHQRMQGISWTRWRLMEFNAKKVNPSVTEMCKAKTENQVTLYENQTLSCEEELQKYVEEKYAQLLNEINLNHFGMKTLITKIAQFHSQNSSNVSSSLKILLCEDVQAIRDKWKDSSKENMIHEVLLQLHLLLECVSHGIKHNDSIKMISSFFRFLTFEESTIYVCDHLNKVILPKFKSSIPEFLQEIYDDLMIEPPSEIGCEEVSPVSSVVQSPSSVYSNISSVPSTCCERKLVKRFPSVAGECSKKFIAVQLKTKEKKNDRKVKRNLFEKNVSTPQKDKISDKSCVPDTPEAKQINNLIWKKQDRDRRHSQIDKNVAPVEESPIKGTSTSLNIRKIHRSNSFNVRSSPRKFYKLQRHPTMTVSRYNEEPKTPTNHYRDLDSVINDKNRFSSSRKFKLNQTPESAIKRRRKALLFSSFTDVKENIQNDISREIFSSNIEEERTGSVRRSIFSQIVLSDTSETKRISGSSSRRIFSESEPISSFNSSFNNFSECFEEELKSTSLKRKQSSSCLIRKKLCLSPKNDGFDPFCDDSKMYETDYKKANKLTFAETTVDWLEKIETDEVGTPRSLTFQEAFIKLSPNRSKSSPTLVKAGDDIISVSPCLSATSIKCLEKAPLLSPYRPIKRSKQRPNRVASK